MLIPLVIVIGIVIFVMPRQQRERLLQTAVIVARRSRESATRTDPDDPEFKAALRARARYVPVTFALVAVMTGVFLFMLLGNAPIADPNTLIAWGGSFGPVTTNGGWWRLISAMFVHPTVLHLAINVAVLLQLGLILERLVGRAAFAGLYFAGGLIGNLVTMSSYRVIVTVGASGAICALYGLLCAAVVWGLQQRSPFAVPTGRLQKIGVLALFFFLLNVANGAVSLAGELTALVIGFACGIVLTRGIHVETPRPRRLGATLGVAAALSIVLALPLRGIADVRPEIAYVLGVEERTAGVYAAAAEQFKKGRMTPDALAQTIAKGIVPELEAADKRLKAVSNVPPETKALMEGAQEYVRLRTESWRLRVDGLRKAEDTPRSVNTGIEPGLDARWRTRAEAQYRANQNTLARAESAERQSLEALERLK
jgi:rhomboid protease GluP